MGGLELRCRTYILLRRDKSKMSGGEGEGDEGARDDGQDVAFDDQ
jgi:hypothetical protein